MPLQNRFIELLLDWYDGKPLFDPIVPIAVANPSLFNLKNIGIDPLKRPGFIDDGNTCVDFADSIRGNDIFKEFSKYVTKGKCYGGINILSPHLDDAVLSLGGIMCKYSNTPVTVQNVFSKSRYLKSGYADKKHVSSIRLIEEKEISKDLSINIILLGFEDWTLRGYDEWNAPRSEPQKYLSEIFSKIMRNSNNEYRALLPLGIGQCVDHQILREYPIEDALYYEDLPYAAYPELSRLTDNMQPNPIKTSRFIDQKKKLMNKYKSQLSERDVRLVEDYALNKNGESYEIIWG